MQVQFAGKSFTKTKYDSLDGKVVVSFKSDDPKFPMESRASMQGCKFTLEIECEEHDDIAQLLHSFGRMLDDTYSEHCRLRQGLRNKLMGNG